MFNRNKNKNAPAQESPKPQEVATKPELTREERLAQAAGWVATLADVSDRSLCSGFGGPITIRQAADQAVRNNFKGLSPDEAQLVRAEILETIEQAGGPGPYLALLDQQEAAASQQ